LRADKYNYPNKTYFTYQFISTYNFNENNLIRGVYSRANRGPFIVDTHADYNWRIVENSALLPNNYTLVWSGTKDLKLPTSDMFEFGYRTKIGQHIIVDLEAFHTFTKDYSYFMPDGMTFTANWGRVLAGVPGATPDLVNVTGSIKYYNFDLTTIQNGLTCNISVAINQKINFRLFGTLQQTELKNFYPLTIWQNFSNMIQSPLNADGAILKNPSDPNRGALITSLVTNGFNKTYQSTNSASDLVNETHKSTPSLFGGASLDYSPTNKITLFGSLYYYTSQTIETNKVDVSNALGASDMYKVAAKVTVNFKVSFKVWKENSIYLNARNFFGNNRKEFAYTDKIGGTYLVGINFNF